MYTQLCNSSTTALTISYISILRYFVVGVLIHEDISLLCIKKHLHCILSITMLVFGIECHVCDSNKLLILADSIILNINYRWFCLKEKYYIKTYCLTYNNAFGLLQYNIKKKVRTCKIFLPVMSPFNPKVDVEKALTQLTIILVVKLCLQTACL